MTPSGIEPVTSRLVAQCLLDLCRCQYLCRERNENSV